MPNRMSQKDKYRLILCRAEINTDFLLDCEKQNKYSLPKSINFKSSLEANCIKIPMAAIVSQEHAQSLPTLG